MTVTYISYLAPSGLWFGVVIYSWGVAPGWFILLFQSFLPYFIQLTGALPQAGLFHSFRAIGLTLFN